MDIYERFKVRIDQMGLRYFKKEKQSIVLEEVSLQLDVGIKNQIKTAIIKGDLSNHSYQIWKELV